MKSINEKGRQVATIDFHFKTIYNDQFARNSADYEPVPIGLLLNN